MLIRIFQNTILFVVLFSALLLACKRQSEGSKKAGIHIEKTVVAHAETEPVPQNRNEDSADDPAIWMNKNNPEKSVIIGTDKKGGLATYDLYGKQLYYYPHGNMNNCDLRYNFPLKEKSVDILAASNRSKHSISIYKISENGVLDSIHARQIVSDMTGEVYGLCLYRSPKTNKFYVFLNSKAGEIEQWELFESENLIDAKPVRSFNLHTQTEGMVADDAYATLYIGKERAGIAKLNAEPTPNFRLKEVSNSSEENNNIKYDIEGLAIYDSGQGNGFLLVSSQGNYSFAIFERQGENNYLGSFRIVAGDIDGAEETDGIDVTNYNLGPDFPKGVLVVQDGYNYDNKKLKAQNFKLISWESIEMNILKSLTLN